MLLDNNSKKVMDLIVQFDNLKNIEKLRLSINILESKYVNYDFCNEIDLLKKQLNLLDNSKMIINFSKYQVLTFLTVKFMELDENDKKHLIIEMLFNIYETDFKDISINEDINHNLCIYDLTYELLDI